MKHFAIILLLLVVPVAIRCEPLISGGGGLGGTTNPLAGLLQTLLNNLIGPNGPLKGLGLNNLITQLLNNLIGNSGSLTGLITGAGQNAGVVQSLITAVLNLLLGSNGILLGILDLGPGGPLSGAGTNVILGLLNALLGPTGLVPSLLGPNGLLGGLLGGGGALNIGNLLNSILGQNGLLTQVLCPLGGGSGGGLLSGILGLLGQILGLCQTGGNTDLSSIINTAMCQLEAMFPGQDLSTVENNCLSQVTIPDLASAIQSFLSNPSSCSASINAGSLLPMDPNLLSFVTCVATGMVNTAG